MSESYARRIAEAISCSLHYEYICFRAGLFDESALKSSIGNVLSTFPISLPTRVASSIVHPDLGAFSTKGRKPEIDFALAEMNRNSVGKISVAVEAKWADSSHCTPENIMYDILRLSILHREAKKRNDEVDCVFVLAGSKSALLRIFSNAIFSSKTNKIPLKNGVQSSIRADAFSHSAKGIWSSLYARFTTVTLDKYLAINGFPRTTTSCYHGLPGIDIPQAGISNTNDLKAKFHAVAWSVRST